MSKLKYTSDLPQILKFSPEQNRKAFQDFHTVGEMHSKNLPNKLVLQESVILSNPSYCLSKPNYKNATQAKTNCVSPAKKVSSPKQYSSIQQKMLGKSKKYYRADAQLRSKQHSIKDDIECLVENMVNEKERNDVIVLNLRDKFRAEEKSLTLNKHYSALMMRKGRLSSTLAERAQRQSENEKQEQNENIDCPIELVNEFSKSSATNKTSVFKLNHQTQDYLARGGQLSIEVKNFKLLIKQYIQSYRSSENSDKFSNLAYNKSSLVNNNSSVPLSQSLSNKQQKNSLSVHGQMNQKRSGNTYFNEFIQLTEKSYDYLECFLKSSFITDSSPSFYPPSQQNQRSLSVLNQTRLYIDSMLKKMDKCAILSVLRSSHKSLQPTHNQKQIVNRILLALNINPMNEFHFIKQETYIRFRKLSAGQSPRKESRDFLLRYFCLENQKIKKEQFQNMLFCLLRKLIPIANESTIEILYEKVKKITRQMIFQVRLENCSSQYNKENAIKKNQNVKKLDRLSLDSEYPKNQQKVQNSKPSKLKNSLSKPPQQYYLKSQIKSILFNDPYCMWDQILELIFAV